MSLKISRILHAGYIFECAGTQIAFDPIFENPFSRNCHAFPAVSFELEQIKALELGAVFISHFHDDHCSMESLNLLNRDTPIYIFCVYEEMRDLIRQLGFKKVYPLELNQTVVIDQFTVIPRRALDAQVDSLFHIQAQGLNILNVVDSWIDPETLELLKQDSPWDLVLWPFQTMRELEVLAPSRASSSPVEIPTEWFEQLRALSPRYIVPSSCQFLQEGWSWYNHAFFPISYAQFTKEISEALPKSHVIRMNPSVSIILDQNSLQAADPLGWVQTIGEQNVDYVFQPELAPPKTAAIAQQFAALSEAQTEKVFEYCQKDLIKKYNSMSPPEDDYFLKPRVWQLSAFDHEGFEKRFFYRIAENRIEFIERAMPEDGSVDWLTQVPISKLFAALELGESLTSMYLRVQPEDNAVDIVEDPLVRCLFNGFFGAYQIAQLKEIRHRENHSGACC